MCLYKMVVSHALLQASVQTFQDQLSSIHHCHHSPTINLSITSIFPPYFLTVPCAFSFSFPPSFAYQLCCPSVHPHPLHLISILLSLSIPLSSIHLSFLEAFQSFFLLLEIMALIPMGKFFLIKCHSHTLTCKHTHKHLTTHTHLYTHKYTHAHIQKACICPNKTSSRQQNEL